jgi:hypothetical protein
MVAYVEEFLINLVSIYYYIKKTDNVRVTQQWGRSGIILSWKSDKYYLLVCVCVRACVRACLLAGTRACGCVHTSKCM